MHSALFDHLEFLYGVEEAREALPQLRAIMEKHPKPGQPLKPSLTLPLSEKDAVLITYGDQVCARSETPLATLQHFLLKHLSGVLNGVHLLPFYPWSSDDGFSVIDYYQVDPDLGSWEEIGRIGQQFDLMFDAVFNHISAQSEWFQRFLQGDPEFADFFLSIEGEPDLSRVVRPRALPLLTEFQSVAGRKKIWTTFSADQVDLNLRHPKVLLRLADALLFYVSQGARYIRLDAIAYLWKEPGTTCIHLPQTHRIIQFMRTVLDEVAPDVMLITETNVPHQDNISYFGDGANEAQLVYNFALPPLVLHSIRRGNASALSEWAGSLVLPSARTTFFNFLASHDGIGVNPARGILSPEEIDALVEGVRAHGGLVSYKNNPDGTTSPYELNINYFDALSNPHEHEPLSLQVSRFMAAQSVLLSMRGLPGIYFHSLFGSRNDRAGAESSGIPRRINRQKLSREELEAALSDPHSLRSQVFSRFRHLLEVRRAEPAFSPQAAQEVVSCAPEVFALLRHARGGSRRVLCLHNLAPAPVPITLAWPGSSETARDLLSPERTFEWRDGKLSIPLQPYEVIWALLD
jgi:glucosylglycerate phosphorylase